MKSLCRLIALSLCLAPIAAAAEPEWHVIIGKALSNRYATVVVNADGTIGGGFAEGTWWEEGGQFCREITAPFMFRGTECQTIEIVGDEALFTDPRGNTMAWRME
ncbi:MAG: hypothetical protein AAGF56_05735 [Pseudomonadota bacterium]